MSASATHLPAAPRHRLDRVRTTLAGIGGKLLFGALGFVLAIGSSTPATNSVPSAPPGVSPSEHEAHHR